MQTNELTVFKINAYTQTEDVPYATVDVIADNKNDALAEARAQIEHDSKTRWFMAPWKA